MTDSDSESETTDSDGESETTDPVIEIRELAPDEIERIGEIAVEAWEPAYEAYHENMGEELFEAKYGDWREHKASQVKRQYQKRPGTVRVAEVDGAVAGFVTFSVDSEKGIGEIGNNAVDPAFQGRGIATRLYRHVLAEFRDRDLEFAEVSTGLGEEYAPARQAYENVGFDIRRATVTYWQEL